MALEDDIGATPVAPPSGSLESDLGVSAQAPPPEPESKEPTSFWGSTKGEADVGLSLVSGAVAGTAGSVLRTANRMIPDWGGTKEELKNKIDSWQNAFTHEPATPEGRYLMGGINKVVQPVAEGLSKATGAVVGKENVPAVADVVGAIPGVDMGAALPAALARGAVRGGAEGAEAMAATAKATEAAGLKTSVGAASGNPVIQTYENLASRLPGGTPLAETRNVNAQASASVSDIIKKINPKYDESPATPRDAGKEIEEGTQSTIARGKNQTNAAAKEMYDAVGGQDAPVSSPKLAAILPSVTGETGMPEIDKLITGAKTRTLVKTASEVIDQPKTPISYSTDGEGAHIVKSPNGETHAVEQANGDLKVWRSDTNKLDAQGNPAEGKGENTARLATLAHIATGKGGNLTSDVSVTPGVVKSYEKLANKGWTVEKNPNAETTEGGRLVSDSPKNPVFTVKAPATEATPGAGTPKQTTESHFGGEWTYDPKTGRSEPVTEPIQNGGPTDKITAKLNPETPWTFEGLKQFRTDIGKSIKRTKDPVQQRQLAQLYGASSDDLKDFVKTKGPDAEQKYEFFNSVAKTNGDQRTALEKAIKNEGGPGEIFTKAMRGSSEDAGRISRVMAAMDEDGKNTFRSVVLHRLGRVGGAQTAPFSADTFLKNWDKMSPEGKNVLFSSPRAFHAGELRTSLDNLTNALTSAKAKGQLRSGLGKELAQAGSHLGQGAGVLGIILALKEFGSPVAHAIEGHPFMAGGTAAAMGGALAINPVMSRVLTNPKLINWLAQSTKMPKSGLPAMIVQLKQMSQKDPDAKELSDLIGDTSGNNKSESQGGGLSEDRAITNSHKMVAMKSPSGSTFYGVDPSTL
jgi:hypothetical protein